MITEAWLTPGDCVPLVKACPSGFPLLHQPRLTSRGGGVNMNIVDFAFFFRLRPPYQIVSHPQNSEWVFAKPSLQWPVHLLLLFLICTLLMKLLSVLHLTLTLLHVLKNVRNFSTISFITFQRLDWIGIRLVYLLPNKNIFFAKIGKSSSSANPTTTGVPQASILGTLLFWSTYLPTGSNNQQIQH